ncbi:hypothetical protein [uncultured Chitinophaga sp.]|jgi:hypothetical protein|uniref:hypothetical protein n=1 Tax=uncultured Chitinophaga sp. TaxID=339340 RepID=UPI0026346075|nr:hypothetical protein [uncultured Chitinophaga sp.]
MILNSPTHYPVFKKGQPLRSDDLNDLISYLEAEELDTRVFLIGTGIFYGLMPSWNANQKQLELTPGAGVTSDGFLLAKDGFTNLVYKGIQGVSNIPYSGGSIPVTVLTTAATDNDKLENLITQQQAVVMLRLKAEDTTKSDCLSSYDNNSVRKDISVEVVLALQQDLEQASEQWRVQHTGSQSGEDLFIHRFGYTGDQEAGATISFSSFTDWKKVKDNFDARCAAAEATIAAVYNDVYNDYAEILEAALPANPLADMAQRLKEARQRINADDNDLSWQLPYYYDYLKDLISAYQEFSYTGFNTLYLTPLKTRFEKYLSLGACTGDQPEAFRMGLYRPPFADADRSTMEKLRLLLKRMIHIGQVSNTIFTANGQLPGTVSITPSALQAAALSRKAIPFYYRDRNLAGGIKSLWNYEAMQQQRLFSIPGVDDATDKKLLLRDMDAYQFFRTQGYIGKTAQQAQEAIIKARNDLHLPFDIKLVFLGTDDTAASLIEGESAWFSDLGLLLEKVVNDIRCSAECGENYENAIFEGTSADMNLGQMFEALGRFFSGVKQDTWTQWVREKCAAICRPNLPGIAAAAAPADTEFSCCPLHLKILFDLYTEYSRRKAEVLEELFFHKFAARHPGLEHNAGVPKGGTLVLVCAAANPSSDKHEVFAAMLRNLKSLNEAAKATLLLEAASLSDYIVVADFCLPYICCSKTPSVKIELQQVQPVADFEIVGEPVALPEEAGKRFRFHNLSSNATVYKWELFDFRGQKTDEKITNNLADDITFDMKYADGVTYLVQLTASRGPLFQQVAKPVVFCPGRKSLLLEDAKGNNKFSWKKDTEVIELQLKTAPYGGEFYLYKNTGGNEWEYVSDNYTILWLDNKLAVEVIYDELPVGTYRLDYAFPQCDITISFSIAIEEADKPSDNTRLVNETTTTDPSADITKTFNRRLQQYRKAVSTIGDEDKTLAKTEKFGKTEAFLRFSGKLPELHNRYADVLKSLQTGLGNAGEKRLQQVSDMAIYSTVFYLDRLLASAPDTQPEEAQTLLPEAAGLIRGQADGLKRLQEVWDTAAVANEQNSGSIKVYKSLLS